MSRFGGITAAALAALVWSGCGSGGGTTKTAVCTPATCASLQASCGEASDGCGGVLQCGGCPDGQTCGGAGVANACGVPACQATTCQALGANCGGIADGCGGELDCGSCPQGQTCGGGGTANVCGTPQAGCTPTTCAAEGKSCGTIPDGCGGQLDCGACGKDQVCSAANACVAAPCSPTTCAAQGKDCGRIQDGCGGTLECGSCPEGQTCGGGGNQNACGAPAPAPEVRWYALLGTVGPDAFIGVGVDGEGARLLLSTTRDEAWPGGGTLHLEKRDRDGARLWTRAWTFKGYPAFRMAVTRLGNVLLGVDSQCWYRCDGYPGLDLGGGEIVDAALVKLGPDGRFVWQVPLAGRGIRAVATDDAGSALVARTARDVSPGALVKYGWDGKLLWSRESEWIEAAALAPTGEAYLAGHASGPLVEGAPEPGPGWIAQIVKLGADGEYQWSVHSQAVGYVGGLATSARGTLVLLADRAGKLVWGDSTVDNGGLVLAVLEPDGRPRWARGVERLWPALLGVDPTGRAAVAGSSYACSAITVRTFDLAGTPLWTRTVPTDGVCGAITRAEAIAYGADHEVTVCGAFGGTMTVAGDRLVPQGEDGIAVQLAP